MAEFFFDYPEQIEALLACGHGRDEAERLAKAEPKPSEVMDCVTRHFGPFSENASVTLMPYSENESGEEPIPLSPSYGDDTDLPF